MIEKQFTIEIIEDKDVFIQQKGENHYLGVNGYVNGGIVVDLLNELHNENEQLKEQREKLFFRERDTKNRWRELKQENEKLWREIHILMRQGAEPSDYFKEYLDSISTEYDKFWQRKLHKAKENKVI